MALTVRKLKAFLELFVMLHPKGYVALVGDDPLLMRWDWVNDMIKLSGGSIETLGVRVQGGDRTEEAEVLAGREIAIESIVQCAGGWKNIIHCARAYRESFEKNWDIFTETCRKGGRGRLNEREVAKKYKVRTIDVARNFDKVLQDISTMVLIRAGRLRHK